MLIILLFLLCISPANRSFSIDQFLLRTRDSTHAPRIYLLLFKAQLEIILIYAGLVKLNSDWLQLEPLRTWLLTRRETLFFGELLQNDPVIAIYAPMTLNNRRPALLIDPTVDLARSHWTLWHDEWLTEYNPNPLRRIEDVSAAEISTKPDVRQALSSMKLPTPKNCRSPGATMPTLFEDAVCFLD